MPDRTSHSVNLDVSTGSDRTHSAPLRDDPFVIVLMGNFRGDAASASSRAPVRERRLTAVDRDDVDEVLGRLAPQFNLDIGAETPVELSFAELDHFHPDEIFQRAPFFRALREARTRLASSESFRGALDSILGGTATPKPTEPRVDAHDVVADTIAGSLLDRIVGKDPPGDSMQAYLRRIVAPHVTPGEDPRREAMLRDLDASLEEGMRAILHHPRFQELESLWRSVDFLVRRMETSATLRVRLLDITEDELRVEGAAVELAQVLSAGCSVLVVDHSFGATSGDFDLLVTLAAVANHLGCALLGGAHPDLLGAGSFGALPEVRDLRTWQDPGWQAFRQTSEAGAVGLVMPRFLLREPYGKDSDPCDRLELEEMKATPTHDHFLWGNGAVVAAALLGRAFAASGWHMRPEQHREITSLPLFTWASPDGPELKPCAECHMTDALAEVIMDAGPMALASIRHGDSARMVRFQSLSSPVTALRGPWSRME